MTAPGNERTFIFFAGEIHFSNIPPIMLSPTSNVVPLGHALISLILAELSLGSKFEALVLLSAAFSDDSFCLLSIAGGSLAV